MMQTIRIFNYEKKKKSLIRMANHMRCFFFLLSNISHRPQWDKHFFFCRNWNRWNDVVIHMLNERRAKIPTSNELHYLFLLLSTAREGRCDDDCPENKQSTNRLNGHLIWMHCNPSTEPNGPHLCVVSITKIILHHTFWLLGRAGPGMEWNAINHAGSHF